MLKRHRCSIDLGLNVLRIVGGSGNEEVNLCANCRSFKPQFYATRACVLYGMAGMEETTRFFVFFCGGISDSITNKSPLVVSFVSSQVPFLAENELPESGTFGKDGQKVAEGGEGDAKADSSSISSSGPAPKKQCSDSHDSAGAGAGARGDGGSDVMSETDKVCTAVIYSLTWLHVPLRIIIYVLLSVCGLWPV